MVGEGVEGVEGVEDDGAGVSTACAGIALKTVPDITTAENTATVVIARKPLRLFLAIYFSLLELPQICLR